MAKKGLGKGLGSLFSDTDIKEVTSSPKANEKKAGGDITAVKLSLIEPNKKQPRSYFYDEKIEDINSLVKKKVIILKKVQKKFLEIQIYIRRESQNYYGFRKQFSNFLITPFILENEYLNKYKTKLNESFEEKINRMKTLNVPIKEIKTKCQTAKNN